MHEIVGTFLWAELRDERANCSIEARNSSCCNLAEECLEFAVSHLDRVEVGRVFRQVTKGRVRFLDRCPNARPEMDAAIVHHNNVVTFERGNQALHDISEKHLTGHGALDYHWCGHFIVAQGGHKGDGLPRSKWNAADHPLAAKRRLIDEHQPGRIKHALLSYPPSARERDIGALLLGRLQAFFLRVMLCRSRNRQSELRLVLIRRLRSSATV